MNKRILKLVNEAGFHQPEMERLGIEDKFQKFAELIVRECAELYNHDDVLAPVGQSAWGEAYQDGWIEGTKIYRETILEHFGVEE